MFKVKKAAGTGYSIEDSVTTIPEESKVMSYAVSQIWDSTGAMCWSKLESKWESEKLAR